MQPRCAPGNSPKTFPQRTLRSRRVEYTKARRMATVFPFSFYRQLQRSALRGANRSAYMKSKFCIRPRGTARKSCHSWYAGATLAPARRCYVGFLKLPRASTNKRANPAAYTRQHARVPHQLQQTSRHNCQKTTSLTFSSTRK